MKLKDLDLFINVIDYWHYNYVVDNFDYKFQLKIGFEDWTGIVDDGKQHIYYTAQYISDTEGILVKFQDENLEKLIKTVHEWNEGHRVTVKKH